MLPATLVLSSDIRHVLGVFKSILSICTPQAGQQITAGQHRYTGQHATSWADQQPAQAGQLTACTIGHQQAKACQHWAELGRSADQAKNPAKSGHNRPCSKGKNAALMTLCPPITLELFHYCICTALYNHSNIFSLLYMYSNTKSLHKNVNFLARIEKTPPCQKF
jgi:hypothetical protein